MPKVAIIGAGQVGASAAFDIASADLADIVLLDVDGGLAAGKALDIMHSQALRGFSVSVSGGADYEEARDADLVVVTAGFPRQPGMSRADVLDKNAAVVKSVVRKAIHLAPAALILVVTNPVDLMSYLVWRISGFDSSRVFGMGGLLDSSRFRYLLSSKTGTLAKDVSAIVLGAHDDTMVPVASRATAGGSPITGLLSEVEIAEIVEATRDAGAEIVSYLRRGSAFYAPAAAVAEMVTCVLRDEKRVMPCSCYARGEYEFDGIYLGLPARIGRAGVEEITEIDLSEEERGMLAQSAELTKRSLRLLQKWFEG